MPRLTAMKTGSRCIFVRLLNGGGGRTQRLADMGILPGEPILIIQNQGHGPVTIYVKGARLALGYKISESIEVEELHDE